LLAGEEKGWMERVCMREKGEKTAREGEKEKERAIETGRERGRRRGREREMERCRA